MSFGLDALRKPAPPVPLFRVLAARKAKYGFIALEGVRVETLQQLAEAQAFIMAADPAAKIELNFNMGANEFKVYTNDVNAAQAIEDKYCAK
jgi:hypothetical protein